MYQQLDSDMASTNITSHHLEKGRLVSHPNIVTDFAVHSEAVLIVTRQTLRLLLYHACTSGLLATYKKRHLDVRPSRHGIWLFWGSCGSGPNNQQVYQLLRYPSPCTMRACLELAEFVVFGLANQRSTDSVTKDSVSKP